jgi:Protein of unknown function (DUF3551)
MWKRIAASGILMIAVGSAPSRAQDMPWCVELDVFTKNCGYTNYNECVAVANNATSPATGTGRCIRNPNYQAPAASAAKTKSPPGQAVKKP